MKEFPERINIKNKHNFEKIYFNRVMCYLRAALTEHILSSTDDNNYFDIGAFTSKFFVSNRSEKSSELVKNVTNELEVMGWKCKTSFGGTGLFIYCSENPPSLCYEEGL